MAEWIPAREAADILGVHISAIPKMIRRGDLTSRRRRPTLNRDQVVALRDARRAAEQALAERRQPKGPPAPPDEAHEWLTPVEAGAVMGVSHVAVNARARRGRLPSVKLEGRRWFRRDHIELVLRADAAKKRRLP